MKENSHLVRVEIDGVDWLVAEEDRERLSAAARTGWEGEVYRLRPGRLVIRVDGKAGPLFLKHFRSHGVGALKGLVRSAPAFREWTALQQARRRGVPVPRPVALGERAGLLHHEGLLVMEALDGTLPLDTVLSGRDALRGPQRWEVIREAARVIRRMHDAGVSQKDLHFGNMLLRPGTAGVYIIDFQRVKVGKAGRETIRLRDLATLHGRCLDASRTDRLRFLKAYVAGPPPLSVDLKPLSALLDRRGIRHRFRTWERLLRRSVLENHEFCPVRIAGFEGFARRAYWNEIVQPLFQDPGALFTRPGVRLFKNNPRRTTAGLIPSSSGSLFVKRYNYRGVIYALKDLFRSSRARRVWIVANGLRRREIQTPFPYAYLERCRFGVALQGYLISEGVEGLGLHESFCRLRESGDWIRRKRQLVRDVAALVRTLHERGVSHRDLKEQNILVREEASGRLSPLLLDLDGVRFICVGWRQRAREVARLARAFPDRSALSDTDRVRFLHAYLGPKHQHLWKDLWHQIHALQSGTQR